MFKKRKTYGEKRFEKWLEENDDPDDIFNPPLPAQEALNILCDHFLGADWYTPNPVNQEQVNCYIVDTIVYRYHKTKQF